MKISVCGKGGSGKSTVVSLLAERLAAAGKEVLKDMMLSNFTHQFFEGQWKLEDIPESYYTEKDGIRLMVSEFLKICRMRCSERAFGIYFLGGFLCSYHAVIVWIKIKYKHFT